MLTEQHEKTAQTDRLLAAYAADYMEKVFYFCLKKTGGPTEAEELAAEITVQIVSALRRGTVPAFFSAWVWQIAKNRYSRWAGRQHLRANPCEACEEKASGPSVEDAFLANEEISLLRRELAFIAREYRTILVAYYLDGQKVEEIADLLSLPAGTVKSRLFHARKKLKEGMNMAREFGKRSYRPENVFFSASGNQPSGLPWRAVQRQIPKNILLQAHNNPSTLEELSIELGIAMPYMEEEVKLLTDATLLTEQNGRFITNFFIADKECQLAIYNAQRKDSKERSRLIDQIVEESLPKIRRLSLVRNGMPDSELKWLLVTRLVDKQIGAAGVTISNVFQRPDGGNWGFMGMEEHDLIAEKTGVSHDGNGNEKAMFWVYSYSSYDLWRTNRMSSEQTLLFGDIVQNGRKVSDLSESEQKLWEKLDGHYAHANEAGEILPDVAVLTMSDRKALSGIFESHPLYDKAVGMVKALSGEVTGILRQRSNPILHAHLAYYASMFMYDIRMMVIHDEVDAGRLLVPEDAKNSTVSMYLEIE